MINSNDFPLILFSTDVADFKVLPDGSISIGGHVTLEPDTVAHLLAFLALPGVREAITGAALNRMRQEYLEDFQAAVEDEQEVLYARY
jgi:hypothetical protein